jgi:hypothetical protein
MTVTVSKAKLFLARLVIVPMVAFVVLGVVLHGFSVTEFKRIWQNLLDRPSGPMTFRFILQPIMATIAALFDGVKDARSGRTAYLWAILTNSAKRGVRLHEGLISTARVILLGLCMDLIYQYIAFDTFHPAEAATIAGLLAFVPYLLLRGPIARVARWWLGRGSANQVQ